MKNLFEDKITHLQEQVVSRVNRPVNVYVTQAVIESFGIRQIDVMNDYGVETIEKLAEIIYKNISAVMLKISVTKPSNEITYNTDYMSVKIKVFLTEYFKGLVHLLPIFIQILSVIIFGYALWTYTQFNILQATSVVFGVITSFVFTGGLVAVISKQISFYWNHKNESMVFQASIYLLKKGILLLLLGNLIIFLLSLFVGVFSWEMGLISSIYSIFIGTALLAIAPLYVIKRRYIITSSILFGSFVSLLLKWLFPNHVYITHWIGIFSVIIFACVYMYYYFKKRITKLDFIEQKEVFPEFIVYHNYKYFFYGTLFYLYIFLDRIIAWSVPLQERFSYFIFFEKDYEIGMDLAIISYLLVAGVMEYSISSFTIFLDALQTTVLMENLKTYNVIFLKKYWANIRLLALSATISFIVQYFLIYSPNGYKLHFDEDLNNLNIQICIFGTIGYFFLSWAALNVLYFFTLGHPQIPLNGILLGLIVNFIVGLLLSRYISYHYSVIGLLAGSIVFMSYTTKEVLKFLKKMDYYYYAAY